MSSFKTYFGTLSVKDPTFGATGDGVTDDGPAIQAAFDAAFGSASSPHGNTNRFLNSAVYFPAGHYMIGNPLYLTHVVGGRIFGNGRESTTLGYNGPQNGNTVVANGVTPLIMTNGLSYSRIEGMSIGCNSQNNTAGIYLYQDGTQGSTSENTFLDIFCQSFTTGILGGLDANGACDNMVFINSHFDSCTLAGLRTVNSNALNWSVYGGGGASCGSASTGPAGNAGALYSCAAGGISPIIGASMSINTYDIINIGGSPMTIIGGSSESPSCIASRGQPLHASGLAYRVGHTSGMVAVLGAITGGSGYVNGTYANVSLTGGTGTLAAATIVVSGGIVTTVQVTAFGRDYTVGDTLSASAASLGGSGSGFSVPISRASCLFVDSQSSGMATLTGCTFAPGNLDGPGTILSLGNSGQAIADGCVSLAGGSTSVISGSAGSKLYLRGNVFSNANTIAAFGGTVKQDI